MVVKSLKVQLYLTMNPSGSKLPEGVKVTLCPGTGLRGANVKFATGNSSIAIVICLLVDAVMFPLSTTSRDTV